MSKLLNKLKNLLKDNRGMGSVEVILIIAVLVGLVFMFKNQITDYVESATGEILDTGSVTEQSSSGVDEPSIIEKRTSQFINGLVSGIQITEYLTTTYGTEIVYEETADANTEESEAVSEEPKNPLEQIGDWASSVSQDISDSVDEFLEDKPPIIRNTGHFVKGATTALVDDATFIVKGGYALATDFPGSCEKIKEGAENVVEAGKAIASCVEVDFANGKIGLKEGVSEAIQEAMVEQWNSMDEDEKWEFLGSTSMDVFTTVVAPAKLANAKKAGKAIDLVYDIADATKVIDKIDDVADAAKTADKIDDIVDAAKTTNKLTDLADDISDGSKIGDEVVEGVFGLCFTADTLVKVEKGYIPIANIEKGMYVYSTNIETNEKAYKQVNEVFVNDARQLFHIKVRDTVIKTTAPHPFYVENKGWVEAKNLVQGDELRLSSGEVAAVQLITIHTLPKSIKVYNFSVEDWHTYYVSEEGVLVHNTGKNPCAADYVEGVGKGTSNLFSNKSLTHLTDVAEGFTKRNGVTGGHNLDMFSKYFDDVQIPYKEVGRNTHPTIDGIYDIQYKVGKKDYTGNYIPDTYTTDLYKKTVYDPSIISNDDIVNWGKEALENATPIITNNGQKYIKGTAANGLKFEGWIDLATDEIKSFYPVFNWRF